MLTRLFIGKQESSKPQHLAGKFGGKTKLTKLSLQNLQETLRNRHRSATVFPPLSLQMMSKVERSQYLRSLLQGTAGASISGLHLTSSNNQHAVDLLTNRFGSKQGMISKRMERLTRRCDQVSSEEEYSPSERKMFWLVKERSLESRLSSEMLSMWRETSRVLM